MDTSLVPPVQCPRTTGPAESLSLADFWDVYQRSVRLLVGAAVAVMAIHAEEIAQ
jgi:hypothetical protein